jgi:hypothetical protein
MDAELFPLLRFERFQETRVQHGRGTGHGTLREAKSIKFTERRITKEKGGLESRPFC